MDSTVARRALAQLDHYLGARVPAQAAPDPDAARTAAILALVHTLDLGLQRGYRLGETP